MIDFDALVVGPTVAVFGEPVLYQPLGAVPYLITAVFDEAYLEQYALDTLMPGNVSNGRPMLGVQLSQFVRPPLQDDTALVVRTGVTYWVNEVRPDSHGGARLLLNLAPP